MLWNYSDDGSVIFLHKAKKDIAEHGTGFSASVLPESVLHYPGYCFYYCNLPAGTASRMGCGFCLQKLSCDSRGRCALQPSVYLRGYLCQERGL